jgi:MioC protein
VQPKYLGHVRYGVIALGDRTYLQTFCFGGKKFDERLQGLGAQRMGEVWCHDASAGTMPEELGARLVPRLAGPGPGPRHGLS